ncbi:restriction endonuclease [Candidatus Pacearchaeota archaeon RBG_13_36_9]|nr:MAG: restriction endonuclease [Candidatus Pacearchaeota archaeon RBG_13_36_9]
MGIKINEIYTGDCLKLMGEIRDNFVDLTITSPPYDDLRNYNGYSFEFERIAKELFRITKDRGIVVWVVGDRINGGYSMTSFKQALFFKQIGFQAHDVMIYKKKNTPFMRKGAYTNCYEFMFVLSKGKPKTFNALKEKTVRSGYELMPYNKRADGINKKQLGKLNKEKVKTNVWEYAVGLGGTTRDKIAFKHPAVFPEKLAEDHILSWSNEGDLVFDPMCGSGTTCKMAVLHRRNYIGCDISEEYCNIARERIKLVRSQQKLTDRKI